MPRVGMGSGMRSSIGSGAAAASASAKRGGPIVGGPIVGGLIVKMKGIQ